MKRFLPLAALLLLGACAHPLSFPMSSDARDMPIRLAPPESKGFLVSWLGQNP